MSRLRIRALVLSAGRGMRLRPLTSNLPKPLLPVAGRPIVSHTLRLLEKYGCEAAAINLHHLGDQLRSQLGDRFGSMPLTYSAEEELLGTLGALGPLRGFFEEADLVVVVNGDSLCRWPLGKLVRQHQSSGAAATLLTSRRADPERYGGGIGVTEDDRIVFLRGSAAPEEPPEGLRRTVFAGLHVFSPRLLADLSDLGDGPADFVEDLYEPLLAAGEPLQAFPTTRDWHDLGTPRRYLEGVLDWTRGRPPRRILRRNWLGEGVVLEEGAEVVRSTVETGAQIAAGARVERSLLLPGARVGAGCEVRDAILGFDVVLPPGTHVERRMINMRRAGYTAREGDSLLGGLVYTPLERERE